MKHGIIILLILCFNVTSQGVISQQDAPQHSIEVEKVTETIYLLKVALDRINIANAIVFVGDDGILLIDGGYPQTVNVFQRELKKISDKDVKFIINTHFHGDHIGINSVFGGKATIIAHKNAAKRMFSGQYLLNEFPEISRPSVQLEDKLTIYFNGEEIELTYIPVSHTDGDVIVHFTKSGIVCVGDLLFADKFPFIDFNSGGNFNNYIGFLKECMDKYSPDTQFIGGHGRLYSKNDLGDYLSALTQSVGIIKKELSTGRTLDDIKKAEVLKKWDSMGDHFISANAWIDMIAEGLSGRVSENKKTIIDPLYHMLSDKDGQAAVEKYKELKRSYPGDYNFSEIDLNLVGYFLIRKGRLKDAIEIFILNVREHSESANVYDSLGEAYENDNQLERAQKNYETAYKIGKENSDPNAQLFKNNLDRVTKKISEKE